MWYVCNMTCTCLCWIHGMFRIYWVKSDSFTLEATGSRFILFTSKYQVSLNYPSWGESNFHANIAGSFEGFFHGRKKKRVVNWMASGQRATVKRPWKSSTRSSRATGFRVEVEWNILDQLARITRGDIFMNREWIVTLIICVLFRKEAIIFGCLFQKQIRICWRKNV